MKEEESIFQSEEKKYYFNDIVKAIKLSGINKGDTVFIHADLSKFGRLSEVKNRNKFNQFFLDACLNSVGKNGTVIIPTFTYSFCNNEIFDYFDSSSTIGYFSELARKSKGFVRTNDPIFSVVVKGPLEKSLTTNLSNNCLGKNSIFDKLLKLNCKILHLGYPFYSTFVHFFEAQLKVPYRYDKIFHGITKIGKDNIEQDVIYNVRNLDLNPLPNIDMIEKAAKNEKTFHKVRLGSGEITSISAQNLFYIIEKLLKTDPYSIVKINKN